MGKLKVLSADIANLIAAGEVVQRPASVVKELMENAVDAGAGQVSVYITDSGRTLIRVIDNGCGMSKTDAMLCFERHATSKIGKSEDLESILTYGFRGEALPSISAVAEIELKTRRSTDETGTRLTIGSFGDRKVSDCSCPAGSSFEIRNLFYNTPARRKFLKSDVVEFKHIVEEFQRIALCCPKTAFSLNHNGRDIYVLKPAKSLKFRILDLMGQGVVSDVIDVQINTSTVNVNGFIGRPDTARKTGGNQYFFVNGRFFRSAYLHKAVLKGYEELIPEGMNPPYFLYLEVDPHNIDVNIHPTKTEVKFEDEQIIFQTLYACIKETLGRNSFGASIDFDTAGAIDLPSLGKSFEEYRGAVEAPKITLDPTYNPFKKTEDSCQAPVFKAKADDYGILFEERVYQEGKAMVLDGKFILAKSASGLMIVNIKRAHERILYEKALKALSKDQPVAQTVMFPIKVQTGVQNQILLEGNSSLLRSLGFDLTPEGQDSVTVNAIPEGYAGDLDKIDSIVGDICTILSDGTSTLSEVLQASMARKFALLGALNAQKTDSPQKALKLLDTLFACENSETTPDGRRIVSILDVAEIEKRF